jgi:hypothetical protein
MQPDQVEFAPVQEFPFDGLPRAEANGRGQRQGEVDIESSLLALRTDSLDFKRIAGGSRSGRGS